MKKPELLIPAGNLETLKTAVAYGADAVYIGGEAYSLRARADNFDHGTMEEALAFAHARGVKVYVTVNIFAHNFDLEGIRNYLNELAGLRPDALIISDPGVVILAAEECPGIDIHISTQMNSTNYMDFLFWQRQGAKRVVCARELSLGEISTIRKVIDDQAPGLEIECFVHGAMCISYSGRCLLSAFMTGRSANRGACTHPCRWNYTLTEETRPGEDFPVEEDSRGTYIFNSRDLCMIGHIPELIDAGVDSFKVEGRMKTELYAAVTARAYRRAIDDYFADPGLYRERIGMYTEEIGKSTHRDFTTGFYFGTPGADAQIYDNSTYVRDYVYLGRAEEAAGERCTGEAAGERCTGEAAGERCTAEIYSATDEINSIPPTFSTADENNAGRPGPAAGAGTTDFTPGPGDRPAFMPGPGDDISADGPGVADSSAGAGDPASSSSFTTVIEQKNKFSVGDTVEILKPDCTDILAKVLRIRDLRTGLDQDSCPHARQMLLVTFDKKIDKGDIIAKKAAPAVPDEDFSVPLL